MKLRMRLLGAIGVVGLVTGSTTASDQNRVAASPQATSQMATATNQKVAQQVAAAIAQNVGSRGYSVSLEFEAGVLKLRGTALSIEQVLEIDEAARIVEAVKRVVNQMNVIANPVQATAYQEPAPIPAPIPAPAVQPQDEVLPPPMPVMQPETGEPVLIPAPPGYAEPGFAAPTAEYNFPQGTGTQYDLPFMPPFAWPAFAPYPNYSAVQYPLNYQRTAWPYIGPFHPYPEAPLDWREVTMVFEPGLCGLGRRPEEPPPGWEQVSLQWDDGHWYLRFPPQSWHRDVRRKLAHYRNRHDDGDCGHCNGWNLRCAKSGFHLRFDDGSPYLIQPVDQRGQPSDRVNVREPNRFWRTRALIRGVAGDGGNSVHATGKLFR